MKTTDEFIESIIDKIIKEYGKCFRNSCVDDAVKSVQEDADKIIWAGAKYKLDYNEFCQKHADEVVNASDSIDGQFIVKDLKNKKDK